jgi:hypothetical protein
MTTIKVRAFYALVISSISLGAIPEASAQLSNPNFDSPYSTSDLVIWAGTGLTTVDKWAAEAAEIVGSENGIVPAGGDQMAKLLDDGSLLTEIKQRVGSIGLLSNAQVDTGTASALLFAHFNVPANAPAGVTAELLLQFLDGSQNPIGLPVSLLSPLLDNDPSSWEKVQMDNVTVPVGSRGAEAIVRYSIPSLTGLAGFVPGYVDRTHLGFSFVPEPSTFGMLLVCGLWGAVSHRRNRNY